MHILFNVTVDNDNPIIPLHVAVNNYKLILSLM